MFFFFIFKPQERQFERDSTDASSSRIKRSDDSPPPTPTPDYSIETMPALYHKNSSNKSIVANTSSSSPMKGTMGRCAAHEIAKANGDAAELESIDSFKLTNPASPTPKPPSLYFNKQSSGPTTLKKPLQQRPLSAVTVTIGEYPDGRSKDPPSKLDFIAAQNEPDIDRNDGDRLQSELLKTLNRSNLKARNDMVNLTHFFWFYNKISIFLRRKRKFPIMHALQRCK